MNLIALIGTVEKDIVFKNKSLAEVLLKIEKPFCESNNDEDRFEYIKVNVNRHIFWQDLKELNKNMLIGIKGRIQIQNKIPEIIVEKLQIF